ncbi:amidase domain-containing protein [Metabacillus sp. RGM 3146]|uniref:amidase domain-containing protein n=1 Tax=Metabacillus sp. RGM 3146 TaxID=3401092 RepID=UPI003B9B690F
MKEQLQKRTNDRLEYLINRRQADRSISLRDLEILERKIQVMDRRGIHAVKGIVKVNITELDLDQEDRLQAIYYDGHNQLFYKDQDNFYLEEIVEKRRAVFDGDELVEDAVLPKPEMEETVAFEADYEERLQFEYDRMAAIQYAERYWNTENPKYKSFTDNCTNFISQCLHAGEAPMHGYPGRGKGWWMQSKNWSYSWTVAHSMKTYMAYSKKGLTATEVSSPEQLIKGDVICYDFQGDGRFDHTTIIVAKDSDNMPLVNANTYNSRMRYWSYEDSTAYTTNIKYKFYHLRDSTHSS